MLSIIESFRLGWLVTISGSIVVLVLVLLFFIVAAVCNILRSPIKNSYIVRYPAIAFVWSFTILICGFVGLCFSCFFFNIPKSLPELFIFRSPIIEDRQGDAKQDAAILKPLSESQEARLPPHAMITGQTPDQVKLCLDKIDIQILSVSETERAARNCLKDD